MIMVIISFGSGLVYDCPIASEATLKDMGK